MKPAARTFGWIPDLPDHRDLYRIVSRSALAGLPARVDLRSVCPPVQDQGALGSCTANAIAAAHHVEQLQQEAATAFAPSRLFIYLEERRRMGTIRQDSGAYIRDGFKVIANLGVCPETMWGYDVSKFAKTPPMKCYLEAAKHQAIRYARVPQHIDDLRAALFAGNLVVFGFTVYESFLGAQVAKTGIVPMPAKGERAQGGHAVAAVGYDMSTRRFIVRNSWGTAWGQKGYCEMPFDYLTSSDLAADFWAVSLVEVG